MRALLIKSVGALLYATLLLGAIPRMAVAQKAKVIAVLPIDHSPHATRILVDVLRGYAGLRVISLARAEEVLGQASFDALTACVNENCRRRILAPLGLDLYLHGQVAASGEALNLRLKLVSSSSKSSDLILMSANQSIADIQSATIRIGVLQAVSDLFSEFGFQSFGAISITSSPQEAQVLLNGKAIGSTPIGPIRLAAGVHRVQLSRAGHRTWKGQIELRSGDDAMISPRLSLRRSKTPLYLGASAAGLAVSGLIFGLHAEQITSAWSKACSSGSCDSGFSAARHVDETRLVNIERTIANALFATAFGLAASAAYSYIFDDGQSEDAP
jgi:hypothetical protein